MENDILQDGSKAQLCHRILKSLGPAFSMIMSLWNGRTLGGTVPVQVYALDEEHKEDGLHHFIRFIKDLCYAWKGPRPIHMANGILDFLFKKLDTDDGMKLSRAEMIILHHYVSDPQMMGGSAHFDGVIKDMREKRRKSAASGKSDTATTASDSGGGGGSTTTLATTPAEKVKVTRETLAATLAACQAAMKQLDEKEDDSPAAAVKKRRKSLKQG